MFRTIDSRIRNARRTAATLTLTCLLLAAISSPPWAQGDTWLLKISEKELQLANPDDPMWMKSNMWDLSFQRMNDRNMPYLELLNDLASDAPITEFRMTIGDDKFHFANDFMGEYVMLAASTLGFDLDSSTADNGDELVVKINGGLDPGEVVRFKIDLDVDAAYEGQIFPHPDFRTVLFDMNGNNVYEGGLIHFSETDNAQVNVKFEMPGMPPVTVGPATFEDQIVADVSGQYYNNIYRRYGIMEPVHTFLVGAAGTVVPEPSSLSLGVFGCLGGAVMGVRARRRRTTRF